MPLPQPEVTQKETAKRLVSVAGGVVWSDLSDGMRERGNVVGHTFRRYDKTSSLGSTTVDSFNNVDQLKTHKSWTVSRERNVYLLLVVHWPVSTCVVDEERNFNPRQGFLHLIVISGAKINHDMLVPG